jgi:heme A synthase
MTRRRKRNGRSTVYALALFAALGVTGQLSTRLSGVAPGEPAPRALTIALGVPLVLAALVLAAVLTRRPRRRARWDDGSGR